MDLYSRFIVGWHLADHMREELIVQAFTKALSQRTPEKELIVHSDRGGQYAGKMFRKLLGTTFRQSMSRLKNVYDNAFMESCFIEGYYNRKRRHSSLGLICPLKFEENYYQQTKIHLT